MAEKPEVKIVRIVNLGDTFTKPTLMDFIKQMVSLEGGIENLYIKKNYKLEVVYAYVIFEKGCDASKAVASLNNFTYEKNTFDVALIAPDLPYKKYVVDISRKPSLKTNSVSSPLSRGEKIANSKFRMGFLNRISSTYPKRPLPNSALFNNWRDRKRDLQHNNSTIRRDRSTEEVEPKRLHAT